MTLLELEKHFEDIPQQTRDFFTNKEDELCLTLCEQFIKQYPNNQSILIYKGICLQRQELFREAIKCFNTVIRLYPDFYIVLRFKAECYFKLKEYPLARNVYKEVLRYSTDNAEDWCYSAICFFLEDRKSFAIALLDYAQTVVSDKSTIPLIKGIMYEHEGQIDDALVSYMESQILSSKDKKVAGEKIYNLLRNNE